MPADGLLRHPRMCQESHKRGFGYHPLFVFLDETGEALAAKLRPGSAGANTAADHVELLDAAIAQLPVTTKATDPEGGAEVLVRADTAGATHGFVDAIVGHGFEFSIGFDVTEAVRRAILDVPEAAWQVPMDQDMAEREGAGVAEITSYLDLSAWPEGTRAIGRREEPHVGAQFNLFDPAGWRHQVFITSSADADIVYLEAAHRGHARVEDHIKEAKAFGLLRFPGRSFAANAAWLLVVLVAQDLIAWAQRLCFVGELARAQAPALLRLAHGGAPRAHRAPPHPAPRRCLAVGHRASRGLRAPRAALLRHLSSSPLVARGPWLYPRPAPSRPFPAP